MKHAWLIACCGCQQLFGLDAPVMIGVDAPLLDDADARMADAQPDAPQACLGDDFDDGVIASMWTRLPAVHQLVESGGQLQVTLNNPGGYDGVYLSNRDVTDAQVDVEVLGVVSGSDALTYLNVTRDLQNYASLNVTAGMLTFMTNQQNTAVSTNIAYAADVHRIWRIAFSSNKVQFWTSDGTTFTMHVERALTFPITSMLIGIGAGKASNAPASGVARLDNFIVYADGCAP